MLFTRCPHCDTIFRVTDQALAKAGGRVRCGRCANVFDATADLRESPDGAAITPPAASALAAVGATAADERATESSPAKTTERRRDGAEAGSASARSEDDTNDAVDAKGAKGAKTAKTARRPAQTAASAKKSTNMSPKSDGATITPAEIEEVLAGAQADDAAQEVPVELEIEALRPRPRGSSKWWRVAAAVAFVALGVQVAHYFRQDLVVKPVVGPLLASTYAVFGVELRPRWRVEQYRIVDSAATAAADNSGTWKVRARFVNDGPLAQPYPLIHLELKNRWQETVRSRRFTPAEYLPPELPRNRLMTPRETAQAALEILDPGPDVSGFELDVCIEVETNVISCRNDEPFL